MDSKWRLNVVDLGLQHPSIQYAASLLSDPMRYVVCINFGVIRVEYGILTPLDTGIPLFSQLVFNQARTGSFPWGLPVEDDH